MEISDEDFDENFLVKLDAVMNKYESKHNSNRNDTSSRSHSQIMKHRDLGQHQPEGSKADDRCWKCNQPMVQKANRRNPRFSFYACTSFPWCTVTRPISKKNNGKVLHFELKVPDLSSFSLIAPDEHPNWLSAIARQLQNAGCSPFLSGEEWMVPLDQYEIAKTKLEAMLSVTFRQIPKGALSFAQKYANNRMDGWLSDEEVKSKLDGLPIYAKKSLFPFQLEAVTYGIHRSGRVLIADEMGTGKTFQAICIALAFRDKWPLLVVVPASMRYSWASEFERWCPHLRPGDIHVIYERKERLDSEKTRPPVVITSYTMLSRLKDSMGQWNWQVVICDESHTLSTSMKTNARNQGIEAEENPLVATSLRCISQAKHAILCSGTPSLNKPFSIFNQINALRTSLLGKRKTDFASDYCNGMKVRQYGRVIPEATGSHYSTELHNLLKASVMVRRLKKEVLKDLPPKLRTVVVVDQTELTDEDIRMCLRDKAANTEEDEEDPDIHDEDVKDGEDDEWLSQISSQGSDQKFQTDSGNLEDSISNRMKDGMMKVKHGCKWIEEKVRASPETKFVVFAHHRSVMDKIQGELEQSLGNILVRIDGSVLPQERTRRIQRMEESKDGARLALVSVTAGGQGIELKMASIGIFMELPPTSFWLRQAEDRLHRHGQKSTVNIYYLVGPPGTDDDSRWQSMCSQIEKVSGIVNEKKDFESLDINGLVDTRLSSSKDLADTSVAGNNASLTCVSQKTQGSGAEEKEDLVSDEGSKPPRDLHFLVSPHTGRIHFYGSASMESHLHFNLRPFEILEASERMKRKEAGVSKQLISSNSFQSLAEILLAADFVREFQALPPRKQRFLLGLPMKPPLCVILEMRERNRIDGLTGSTVRHNADLTGLTHRARGGGLEPGQTEVPVKVYSKYGGVREFKQVIDANGLPLCQICPNHVHYDGTPSHLRDILCSADCYDRCTARISGEELRRLVWQRDAGICEICQRNCVAIVERLAVVKNLKRRFKILVEEDARYADKDYKNRGIKIIKDPRPGLIWEVDHVVPVAGGGGECSVDNCRTLCVACHLHKSRLEAYRRKREREILRATAVASPSIMDSWLLNSSQSTQSQSQEGKSKTEKVGTVEETWSCSSCTLFNSSTDTHCKVCQSSRPRKRKIGTPQSSSLVRTLVSSGYSEDQAQHFKVQKSLDSSSACFGGSAEYNLNVNGAAENVLKIKILQTPAKQSKNQHGEPKSPTNVSHDASSSDDDDWMSCPLNFSTPKM